MNSFDLWNYIYTVTFWATFNHLTPVFAFQVWVKWAQKHHHTHHDNLTGDCCFCLSIFFSLLN